MISQHEGIRRIAILIGCFAGPAWFMRAIHVNGYMTPPSHEWLLILIVMLAISGGAWLLVHAVSSTMAWVADGFKKRPQP